MADSRKSRSTDLLPDAVARCLERYVCPGQTIALGLSGGSDSVALLHALRRLGVAVTAVHVHHGLHAAADAWEGFCRELCRSWETDLVVERVTVERGSADGLEAAARRARHRAFARVGADWLALGHHRGDRAETLLFNLLRGAGVRGAGAMGECNDRLLRPLIHVGRGDILAYARAEGLHWIDDPSNADTRFSRNLLRHRVLPEIELRFADADRRLAGAAERFAEAADLLDDLAVIDLAGHASAFPLPVGVLAALSEPRARNVLRFLLYRAGVGIPSEVRLTEAVRQLLTSAPDRHPAVAFGSWLLRRRARTVVLEKC